MPMSKCIKTLISVLVFWARNIVLCKDLFINKSIDWYSVIIIGVKKNIVVGVLLLLVFIPAGHDNKLYL